MLCNCVMYLIRRVPVFLDVTNNPINDTSFVRLLFV
jgi:hypothetical protein